MKVHLAALFAVLLVFPSVIAQEIPEHPGYRLTWSDEFDGNALNLEKWEYRTDSKMLSTQLPENVSVQDGNLTIALTKSSGGGKSLYTGGGVISRNAFRYGLYEARLKIEAGSGWHSSFWMMRYNGVNTRGDKTTLELDTIENKSKSMLHYGVNTHRWQGTHEAMGGRSVETPDLSKDFHIFGCEYQPDVVRYFFDGKLVTEVDLHGQPQGDMNIWLTSIAEAMSSNHGVDDNALPGKMLVDWVRFYTRQ